MCKVDTCKVDQEERWSLECNVENRLSCLNLVDLVLADRQAVIESLPDRRSLIHTNSDAVVTDQQLLSRLSAVRNAIIATELCTGERHSFDKAPQMMPGSPERGVLSKAQESLPSPSSVLDFSMRAPLPPSLPSVNSEHTDMGAIDQDQPAATELNPVPFIGWVQDPEPTVRSRSATWPRSSWWKRFCAEVREKRQQAIQKALLQKDAAARDKKLDLASWMKGAVIQEKRQEARGVFRTESEQSTCKRKQANLLKKGVSDALSTASQVQQHHAIERHCMMRTSLHAAPTTEPHTAMEKLAMMKASRENLTAAVTAVKAKRVHMSEREEQQWEDARLKKMRLLRETVEKQEPASPCRVYVDPAHTLFRVKRVKVRTATGHHVTSYLTPQWS
jgi:hypothetical protein